MSGINGLLVNHCENVQSAHTERRKNESVYSYSPKDNLEEKEQGKVLGEDKIYDSVENVSYKLSAAHEKNGSYIVDSPVIKITISRENENVREFFVDIGKVNPQNASVIEMFALCNYENVQDSWRTLKMIQGENLWNGKETWEELSLQKQDFKSMIQNATDEYMDAGLYKEVMDGKKLLSLFEKYKKSTNAGNVTDSEEIVGWQPKKEYLWDDNQWMEIHKIAVLDVDDGFASIEFHDSGELRYYNVLNREADWIMKVTPEQMKKARDLSLDFKMFMNDKTFWENYLSGEVNEEELAEMAKQLNKKENYEKILGQFSDSIKYAWKQATAESGTNGFNVDEDGKLLCMSEFAKKYIIAAMKGENTDLLGNSVESVLEFAKEIVERLNDSHQTVYNKELQKIKDSEKAFYEKLIEKLEKL